MGRNIHIYVVKMTKTLNFYLELARFSSVTKTEIFPLHLLLFGQVFFY